jgi:hypothetical protein
MLFFAWLGSLAFLSFALEKDLEKLEERSPKIVAQVLDPETKKELPWTLSRPEILFLPRADDRT